MKAKTRLVRVKTETHTEAARLSNELGISMSAVFAFGLDSLRRHGLKLMLVPDTKYEKRNVRSAGRKAVVR